MTRNPRDPNTQPDDEQQESKRFESPPWRGAHSLGNLMARIVNQAATAAKQRTMTPITALPLTKVPIAMYVAATVIAPKKMIPWSLGLTAASAGGSARRARSPA